MIYGFNIVSGTAVLGFQDIHLEEKMKVGYEKQMADVYICEKQ